MDPTTIRDEQHGPHHQKILATWTPPPNETSNMDPTTKRDEQHGPHHQKRRATWTPPPKEMSNMDPTKKDQGEPSCSRSQHLIGYHIKYISFSKKMYKYLDITKPDNGIRINTNIDIDKCKFEPCSSEVYSIQHYVITFVHDLRQVGGFLRVLLFPPPIKLISTIQLKYC